MPPISESFTADVSDYLAKIQALIDQTEKATQSVRDLHAEIEALPDVKNISVNVIGDANETITAIRENLATLDGRTISVGVIYKTAGGPDVASAEQIIRQTVVPSNLGDTFSQVITPNDAGNTAAQEGLAAAISDVTAKLQGESNTAAQDAAVLSRLAYTIQTVRAATDDTNDSVSVGIPLWLTGSGIFGAWNSHIQLFGGALTQIGIPAILATAGTIHVLTDSVLEIASTLIPAAIAFGAFGVAAAGPFIDIYNHEKDVFTVTQALQEEMYPFTGQLTALQNAVKPEVFVLFGEALEVMTKNTGAFTELATGAGHVLDELGARLTYALTSGNGFSAFLKNSVADLQGWGTLIGNIGGILGNLLKALPGFGQAFLAVAVNVTHFAESLTGATIPLENFLLIGHGLLLWLGLAGTVGSWAIINLLSGVASMAAKVAGSLVNIPVVGTAVANAFTKISIAAGGLADLPWGWILIVAAGLGVLVYHFATLTSAATQFADTIQQKLLSGPLNTLAENIQSTFKNAEQSAATANNAFAEAKVSIDNLNASMQKNGTSALQNLGAIQQTNAAYQNAANSAADWGAVVKVAQGDQSTYNTNMKTAVGVFGSASAALNAFTDAGLGSSAFLTTSSQQFAQNIIESKGYRDAMKAATDGVGRFAAAENALSFAAEDNNNKLGQIDQSMTQITQAQTQLIGVMTGGESAFITFQQNMNTLATDSKAAGASMTGLSANALTMQSQFYGNITSMQSFINASEMQGVSTATLSAEVATGSKQLVTYAGNNAAAKSVIVDMINDALGPGTVSFQNLDSWVKQNSTSQQGFAADVAKTTIAAGQLAQTLGSDLNAMMAQSIVDAYGGQKAFDTFAQQALAGATLASSQFVTSGQEVIKTLLAQSGNNVPAAERAFISYAENGLGYSKNQAQNLWGTLYSNLNPSLQNSGTQAYKATGDVNNFAAALARVPKNTQVNFTVSGSGGEYITSSVGPGGSVHVYPVKAAAQGGVIPGYEPGKDSVLTYLSKGEGILIPQAVRALGGEAGINALNKSAQHFAWGGVTGLPSQMSALAGADFGAANAAVASQALGTINSQVKSKLAAQVAAALAASGSGAALGGNVVSWVEAAMKDTGAPSSWLSYLLRLVSLESGGNPNAVDPISVMGEHASGLFQTLPSTYAEFATVGGGVFNPIADAVAGIRYIMGTYGSPANIPGLMSGHYVGYDQGGYLMPGLTMAYNGTGQPEKVSPAGGDNGMIHNVIQISGKTIYESIQPHAYRDAARNNGNGASGGYWTPGSGNRNPAFRK